jgi:hypothetical protein
MKDVYVVGCGPSLRNFDWRTLDGRVVIAINGSMASYPNATYALTADSRFAVMSHTFAYWQSAARRVLIMRRDHAAFHRVAPFLNEWHVHIEPTRFDGQISLTSDDFCTGQNSGFCGMQFAVRLGATCVHLLGMDFHTDGGAHFHSLYGSNPSKLSEFLEHFKTATAILQSNDIRVVSHSPTSLLNAYVELERLGNA